MVIAPSISTGTFGVAPQDAGVACATVTVGQQLGASIGTSLLTIFAGAVTSYVAAHVALRRRTPRRRPDHRPTSADRAGAGARLRHGILVDRRHLRRRGRHRGRPAPPGPLAPAGPPSPVPALAPTVPSQDRNGGA